MTRSLTVLVTGSTGTQGGAVARLLLSKGHRVRALTRDLDKPAAAALAGLGAQLVRGDLEDRASLDRAAAGVDAVFAVATPFQAGTEAETRQGIHTADAALRAGAHLVYSSVANADRDTGIPHFDSKFRVEQHIRRRGGDATIVAPAYFMENLQFIRQQLRDGVYASALTPDRKLAQVAVADIAAVSVAVIEDRARHAGQRYDLSGDELSGTESIAILSRVTGRGLSYFQMPLPMVQAAMGEDGVKMIQRFEATGYTTDRAELRRTFPEAPWLTYEAWARSQDWAWLDGR
jgi:uncharacterized protein YbjT (DUF2867 family)